MVTDSLEAVTVLEFDETCAQNVRLIRCQNCGLWLMPKTGSNCYCDRPSPQNPTKTCKEVGPNYRYRVKIAGEPIREFSEKIIKRGRTQAQREEKQEKITCASTIITNWQYNVKSMADKVAAGEITEEQFLQAVDHGGPEIVRNKGELFHYDKHDNQE